MATDREEGRIDVLSGLKKYGCAEGGIECPDRIGGELDRAWHELEARLPDEYRIRSLIRAKGAWEVVVAGPSGIRIGRGPTPVRAMGDIS